VYQTSPPIIIPQKLEKKAKHSTKISIGLIRKQQSSPTDLLKKGQDFNGGMWSLGAPRGLRDCFDGQLFDVTPILDCGYMQENNHSPGHKPGLNDHWLNSTHEIEASLSPDWRSNRFKYLIRGLDSGTG
jgi:hypothetical protein